MPVLQRLPLAYLLLLGLALTASTARAQLIAEPTALSVTVAQGEVAEHSLTLTNTGTDTASFCLSFERPLQREDGLRLGERATGGACGEIGEVLLQVDEQSAMIGWDPYGLTMTPDGRLFVADNNGDYTHELTPELEVVRSFEHPAVAELSTFPKTRGVTYNPATEMLWWLNIEEQGQDFRRAMLIEGSLDGDPTGRRIVLPTHPTEGDTLYPLGLSFDPATDQFYTIGAFLDGPVTLWAVDTTGSVVPGYPVEQTAYPEARSLGFGPDAFGGWDPDGGPEGTPGEAEAVRIEVSPVPVGGSGFDRLAVVAAEGGDLRLETPLPDVSGGTGFGSIEGESLRSRVDPNGVVYVPFVNFATEGIVGIRPHPLPPSWLALSAWSGELGPGESVEIGLTFATSTRAVGNSYEAVLQVFEAATGEALEVPLSLEVTESTTGEEEPELRAASLSVYPNPLDASAATIEVELARASEASVEVFDVLGRRVAVFHNGPLTVGTHRFRLDAAALPAGVYLVRATGNGFATSQRLTLLR